MNQEFQDWLESRPQIIKELATKYPPGQYRIKVGAPYSITCPGTIVSLESYLESKSIYVVVEPHDLLPEAIAHQKELCEFHGTNYEELKDYAVKVQVDPIWLQPL